MPFAGETVFYSKSASVIDWILSQTGARAVREVTLVQQLWNGYGELLRISLEGGPRASVIVKKVVPPAHLSRSVSDLRKKRSYEVERNWYQEGAPRCDEQHCRVARMLGLKIEGETSLMLLEDLCDSGYFPDRRPSPERVRSGLAWFASFHARFLEQIPEGLWEQGSYWHFGTRQEEWERMPPGPLKDHAADLDRALRATRYRTLLHGDPKPANFCWNADHQAAAVDFQYVGGGCGIRDVILFMDRGLGRRRCREEEDRWLDFYFQRLFEAIGRDGREVDHEALESDWRPRFAVAWSDYARFYQGWAGDHSLDAYGQELLERALESI